MENILIQAGIGIGKNMLIPIPILIGITILTNGI
jgi:hypothetical protein